MSTRTAKTAIASAVAVLALAMVPAVVTLAQVAHGIRGTVVVEQPAEAKPAPETKPAAAEPATEEPPAETPAEAEPVDCVNDPTGKISIPSIEWGDNEVYGVHLLGEIADAGPTGAAQGTASLNADGQVITYTVAEGDTFFGIGERFCIDWHSVSTYNHTLDWEIQPGQTLTLRPDPDAAWDPEMDWYMEDDKA
jgi:LysM repeat protein